ncbi:MAG: hypothetical protein HUU55_08030 [Myxococcales bacterium]|nr:hypothetical protein [Myxococcales bacterium]
MTNPPNVIYLPYSLTLRAALMLSELSGDSPSGATLKYIPGSSIRGAVAARLLKSGTAEQDDVFQTLILSDQVRYLNCYVGIDKKRSWPVPLSWRVSKEEQQIAWDSIYFCGTDPIPKHGSNSATDWPENAGGAIGYLCCAPTTSSEYHVVCKPQVDGRVHQQRDRVKGRPGTSAQATGEVRHGKIFAREYLEPGQTFYGVVQLMPAAHAYLEHVRSLLTGSLYLGRSLRAGYGGDLEVVCDETTGHEYDYAKGIVRNDLAPGQRFRVLLTSPFVGRDPITGQLDPCAIEQELVQLFDHRVTVLARRWAFTVIGSFNRKWRLEVPQAPALFPGTILVLIASGHIAQRDLRHIEHEGIGERKTEGCGRLVFLEYDERNKKNEPSIRIKPVDPQGLVTEIVQVNTSTVAHSAALQFAEQRVVLQAALQGLEQTMWRLWEKTDSKTIPNPTILGKLRVPLRAATDEPSAANALVVLRDLCTDDRDNSGTATHNRIERLKRCQLSEGTLQDWLNQMTAAHFCGAGSWQLLSKQIPQSNLSVLPCNVHITTAEAATRLLEDNIRFLKVRLIDSVLAALQKKAKQG